jgi:hypothetical protein
MDALQTIYNSILTQHLTQSGFTQQCIKSTPQLVAGALTFHNKVAQNFLPTAIKFHYIFNLRDLSNIFQVSRALQLKIELFFVKFNLNHRCLNHRYLNNSVVNYLFHIID